MSTDIPPVLESLMCDDSGEKGDETLEVVNTTDTPGTSTKVTRSGNQDTYDMEASPTTTEENSPKIVRKKKGIHSIFRSTWKAIKSLCRHRRNKVAPHPTDLEPAPGPSNLGAANKTDSVDLEPVPGPSNLKAADKMDSADFEPVPGPSNIKAANKIDFADLKPVPGPSNLRAADKTDSADLKPVPGPFKLKAADKTDRADLKPVLRSSSAVSEMHAWDFKPGPPNIIAALSSSEYETPAVQQQLSETERNTFFSFLCRIRKTVKQLFTGRISFPPLYEVGEYIGGGCSGSVYEGTRKSDGKKVAIKCVNCINWPNLDEIQSEVIVNLFLKEPQVCPNIVEMYDWVQKRTKYLLVMEYPYPCVPLQTFIKNNGGVLSEPVARDIMLQIIEALDYCLNRGILHYDLHFGNMLINTDTMQVKLIDFGRARIMKRTLKDPRSRFMFELPPESRFVGFVDGMGATVWLLGRALTSMVKGNQRKLQTDLSKEIYDLLDQCSESRSISTIKEMLAHDWFTKKEQT